MKPLVISLAALGLILGFSLWAGSYVAARTEDWSAQLAKADNFAQAERWAQAEEGERVLLQGVVDCWFETLEGITVVDFKTDRIRKEELQARAEFYRSQLMAYSRALEEVTGRNVVRKVLWFFALNQAVELP